MKNSTNILNNKSQISCVFKEVNKKINKEHF